MKVLVANRGEIACRILHTLAEMGIPSVAVHTDVDRESPHVGLAGEAVALGATDGYLKPDLILDAARATGATAIHPGYGFLSQNAAFARACREAGIRFIGPSPESMLALGEKRAARTTAEAAGVPVIPGAKECDTLDDAQRAADRVGYPILLKAAGGGGGKGMRLVRAADELAEAFAGARRESLGAFADDRLLVERYVHPARHVEVQILGDGKDAIALGERECSLQRRYQKVIEESPSTAISERTRAALCAAAVALARAVHYESAGTVEFLVGPNEDFYFLEVNTRLQVEHPVTELRTGLDLVGAQVEIARGGKLPAPPAPRGHAIEARLYAEDPYRGFLPATGKILMLEWPLRPHVRVDTGIRPGQEILPFYDPILAKLITWGEDREEARRRLVSALRETVLLGLATNQSFLLDILESDFFIRGETYTTTLEANTWPAPAVPEAIAAAAAEALRTLRPGGAATGAADGPGLDRRGDPFSPWRTLGPFRMSETTAGGGA